MAKSRNKKSSTPANTPRINPENEARRQRERKLKRNKTLRDWGLTLLVICVVGLGVFQYSRVSAAKEDLTRVGQGKPMVVQVHDIECLPCLKLQTQTKRAMRSFDKDEVGYVIADLQSRKGGYWARLHRAGQTTLVLVDGKGEVVQRIVGEQSQEFIEYSIKQAFKIDTKG